MKRNFKRCLSLVFAVAFVLSSAFVASKSVKAAVPSITSITLNVDASKFETPKGGDAISDSVLDYGKDMFTDGAAISITTDPALTSEKLLAEYDAVPCQLSEDGKSVDFDSESFVAGRKWGVAVNTNLLGEDPEYAYEDGVTTVSAGDNEVVISNTNAKGFMGIVVLGEVAEGDEIEEEAENTDAAADAKKEVKAVKTGDASTAMPVAILVLALGTCAVTFVRRKRA